MVQPALIRPRAGTSTTVARTLTASLLGGALFGGALFGGGCAIVDSVANTVLAVNRYARGIVQGKGETENGAQIGDWTYLSENGEVVARGRYENDEQVGVWTYYYAGGNQKEYEGEISSAGRVGPYRYWHSNGNQRAAGRFAAGTETGEWTFWNPRGRMTQRGTFDDGMRHGRWVSFHDDGTRAADGLYHRGVQVGTWRLWDEDGTESLAWKPLPDGVDWAEERWEEGGTTRRAGFLRAGRPQGIWTIYHRSGEPRLVGTFERGIADGPWAAYDEDGNAVAAGDVRLDRPDGTWAIGGRDVEASGFAPPAPFDGTWSRADLVREAGVESAIITWLAEAASPLAEGAIVKMHEPDVTVDDSELVAADVPADGPTIAQPWTVSELQNIDLLVDFYQGSKDALRRLQSRYARRGSTEAIALPEPEGDRARAQHYLDKAFPLRVFKDEAGNDMDLDSLKGSKVVLVVLRGYGQGVCVYCTTQTKALYQSGAFEKFDELGAKLHVVFPGEANGLATFKESYASISEEELPPYGLLYQNCTLVADTLDLEGSQVIPSTFILDEEGKVRWAYIGKSAEDRPPVPMLISALESLP